jgi:molybdopterin-guanine dinucleotide biosynthesis protein B
MTPIVSIIGKSGSGKTTLIEKLIPELKKRGYRVGAIKHARHGFDIDRRGKDSHRLKAAGADTVIVAGPDTVAMVKDTPAVSLEGLAAYVADMDLVVTEGFKSGSNPKIEICRAATGKPPLTPRHACLVAFVSDTDFDLGVPKFDPDDVATIARFLEQRFLRPGTVPLRQAGAIES